MTNNQRDVYMVLLMAGREAEALAFRDRCNAAESTNRITGSAQSYSSPNWRCPTCRVISTLTNNDEAPHYCYRCPVCGEVTGADLWEEADVPHFTEKEWAQNVHDCPNYHGKWEATPFNIDRVAAGELPAVYIGRRNMLTYQEGKGTVLVTEGIHFTIGE